MHEADYKQLKEDDKYLESLFSEIKKILMENNSYTNENNIQQEKQYLNFINNNNQINHNFKNYNNNNNVNTLFNYDQNLCHWIRAHVVNAG